MVDKRVRFTADSRWIYRYQPFDLPLIAVHLTADSRSPNGYRWHLGKTNGDYMGITLIIAVSCK
jgi:hypothetical protein